MKLLVTGGMGFIGSNFIRRMYERYPTYKLVNVDALTYAGNLENLAEIESQERKKSDERRYRFVKGDITESAFVKQIIEQEQPNIIINFAAESHVDRSFVDAGTFIRTNVLGMEYLLQTARANKVPFIQISTDEIYGDVPSGESDEQSPLRPSNPYAASKAAADLLAQTYMRSMIASVIIVRGSNNFGPYQYPEKLIPLAITNLIEGKKIPVHGDGQHKRRWIHVDDFVDGVDLVLHNAIPGSIYNIAGHEVSNIELLNRLAALHKVTPKDALEFVADRPCADRRYAPSSSKIERELGWKPKRHIDEALAEVVQWYATHPEWWKRIKEKREFLDHYEKQRHAKYY
ncbi:dTDP-glucose 4,6-dehydratase [Candidatus Parcubacteria bacterium]|nr:dTDP-glucose 4,6-dehydratase [Candidatus Parcubacteria bacterium]